MSIACPVCQSSDTVVLGPPMYRKPTTVAGVVIDLSDLALNWRRCQACGYFFVHPTIPEERLLKCYSEAKTGYWGTEKALSLVRFYEEKKSLLERFSPGKRVLDFGCYDGGFLDYLGSGYEKFGIEPSNDAAAIAKQRGVTIVGPTIAAALADDPNRTPMDAIVSFDVFEHLNDPVGTLRDLRKLLKPGGVILIETGNTDAPLFHRMGLRYPYAAYVEHVGLFNESSIREAGKQAGLSLVNFQRSAHHTLGLYHRITYRFKNGVYHTLRAMDSMKLPLPARIRQVARGTLPRSTERDHFLAVLRAT